MLMMPDGGSAVRPVPPPPPPPKPPKPPKPPPAAQVSAAYQALTHNLSGKQVNAKTMQAAVSAAAAYTTLSKQAIAQAALLVQAQYDAQRRAAGKPPPPNAYAQASHELSQIKGGKNQPLFDPTVLANATDAMSQGDVAAVPNRTVASYNPPMVCTVHQPDPKPLPPLPPGQSAPTVNQAQAQIETYLQSGMSLQAAIGAARVQYGGASANEPTLAEAALATQAPTQMGAYQKNPQGGDPVQLASKQIAALKVFSPSTLAQATKTMTVKLPDKPVDGSAAQKAAAKLAKDRAAKASPAAIAADMATYRTALNGELDAATGKHGTAWFNDPTQIDAWLEGEVTLADTNLQSLAQAAQGTSSHSAAQQALDNGEHDLGLALDETQTIADVTNTHAAQPGDAPTLAQTQRLTGDLQALGLVNGANQPVPDSKANPDAQAEYNDILNDPAIQKLRTDAQNDVSDAAGIGNSCEPQAQAERALRQASTILSEYQGTVFYTAILTHAKQSASVQARFNDLGAVKPGGAPDVLHEETNILTAVAVPGDSDLTDALYQQKFQGKVEYSVAHDNWKVPSGLDIVSKLQAPEYYADVSNLYAALGGKNTKPGQSLLNVVMNRMNGNNFVGYTYYGSLTNDGPDEEIKSYYLNWIGGNDGNPKGNYQLYQDIADTDKNKNTVRFVDAELPGKLAGPASAPNGPPVYVRPGDTPLPSGPLTLTSRTDLLNTLGKAYHQTPLANAPASGVQYDGNTVVYGKTTLNDLVNATLASQNLANLNTQNPLVLSLTPIEYWNNEQDPQKDSPQQLWLEQTDGAAGRRYVGPAKTQAQASYQDWLNDSGFAPGTLLSQQNVVYDAQGQQRVNWDQTNIAAPQKKESWEEKALHVGEVALTVGAVAVTTFVAPEADGLLLPLLYDAAQTYFAVSSAVNIGDSAAKIWQDPTSWRNWVSGGFTIAANAFMDASALGHFGLTRAPDLLLRGLSAGRAVEAGSAVGNGARVLATAFDNAAGARSYMALAGAPDGLLATLRWTQRGAALTNGVLLAVQGEQIGDALVHGRAVSASELIQFVSTIGMGQFGKVLGLQHVTSLADLRGQGKDQQDDENAQRPAVGAASPNDLPDYVLAQAPDTTQTPRLFTAGADSVAAADGSAGHSSLLDALERAQWNRRVRGPSLPPLSDRRLTQIANRPGNGGPISEAVAPHVRMVTPESSLRPTSFSMERVGAQGNSETVTVDLELPNQSSWTLAQAAAGSLPPSPAKEAAAKASAPTHPVRRSSSQDGSSPSPDFRPAAPGGARRIVVRTAYQAAPLAEPSSPGPADAENLAVQKPEVPAGTDVDNITSEFDKRGLSSFNLLGGADAAGKALGDKLAAADAQHRSLKLMLVTGFSVDIDPATGLPMPETDGPPGTAYLAANVQKLSDARVAQGKLPIRMKVVVDSANQPVMQAALDAAGAHDANVTLFDEPYQEPVKGAVTAYQSGAKPAAHDLLDQQEPDAVVAVELPAHTSESGPRNMRGKSVAPFNSARDAIVEAANDRHILTIGVGDGGNEAGVVQKTLPPGVQQTIPMVTMPDGHQVLFQSAVPTDISVTAWNSSLGAQAIGLALLKNQGMLELAPSAQAYGSIIDATAGAGAFDGVLRVRAPSIDGFDKSVHMANTNALIAAAADPHGVFLPARPDVVVVFDSSNGALVAHDALEQAISAETGRAVQFVYIVDHGHAPYGQYQSPEQLRFMGELVGKAQQTGDEIPSSSVFIMACNTAHGAHYEGMMDLEAAQTPVVNLIETTATLMLERGGTKPAMFATAACVKTHMYLDRVTELGNGQTRLQEVGAPNWADFVNRMQHQSDDPAVQARVQADVDATVARLSPDTSSVWLCCTHYPALTGQIRAALDARGMQDVPIINPMAEQGAAARAVINWDPLPEGVSAQVRNPAPIVITTGDAQAVGADARELTGYANVRTIHVDNFGTGMDLQAVHDALARPQLKPISRALASQWHAGGPEHTASQTRIFAPNGAENAAEQLPASHRAMVLVGSAPAAANADAVTAAALLGSGMPSMDEGVQTLYVTDAASVASLRSTLAAAGVPQARVTSFPGGEPALGAAKLLDQYQPDTVYALKVHGRNAAGQYHATDGSELENVAPLDEIVLAANRREGISTVGIGDAPIYAGLLSRNSDAWYEVRPVTRDDGGMVNTGSVVPADFPVTGPTATIASDGVAAALNAAGRRDVLHTPEALQAMMRAALGDAAGDMDTPTPASLDYAVHDDGLEGLRGDMTQAVHALLLSLREPAGPSPSGAQPGSGPKPGGARVNETAEPSEAAESTNTPAPTPERDQVVPGAAWPALRAQLAGGTPSEAGDVYVYRVQGPAGQNADTAAQGLQGKLLGWGHVPQGSGKGRWLGQSMPGAAPGSRIEDKRLGGLGEKPLGPQDYLVVSRTSPQAWQAAPSGASEFAEADWAGPHAALNWGTAAAVPVSAAADPAGAASESAGAPRQWRRVAATLGLSAGTATGLIEGASNVPVLMTAAATSSLCFIYRGGMVALRTRLGTLISRHVSGAGGAAPEQHLDWLERNLVGRGALWGIPKSARATYADAIGALRAEPGNEQALQALAGAPQRLYQPNTVAGNVNDALQLGTLATNVALNAHTVLGLGVAAGADTFAMSVGFGLSNFVLSSKNAATRVSGWAKTSRTAVMLRVQGLAQATVMTGYAVSTVPWALGDYASGGAVGVLKAGFDTVFGLGSAVQGFNDTRALRSAKSSQPVKIGGVHPLMLLGAGAVARFVLQLATLAKPPASSSSAVTTSVASAAFANVVPLGPNGLPAAFGQGATGAAQPDRFAHASAPVANQARAPLVVTALYTHRVRAGENLWEISAANLGELLTQAQQDAPGARDSATQIDTALHQLLQLNPQVDPARGHDAAELRIGEVLDLT